MRPLLALSIFTLFPLGSCADAPLSPCGGGACEAADEGALASEYALSNLADHPEGGSFDPVSRSFFAGSMRTGDIVRMDAAGNETVLFDATEENAASLGMDVDAQARTLWSCHIINEGANPGTIRAFDIDSGALRLELALEALAVGASCNDVVAAPDGSAYITDRESPHIYRVQPDGSGAVFASDPLLEPGTVGLNGIEITPDGQYLIATKYLAARLMRISLRDPSDIIETQVTGDRFHVVLRPFAGADGLELHNGHMYLAFDEKVMRLTPNDDWSIIDREAFRVDSHGGVTAIVSAEGALFGFNGQAPEFIFGDTPVPPAIWRIDEID